MAHSLQHLQGATDGDTSLARSTCRLEGCRDKHPRQLTVVSVSVPSTLLCGNTFSFHNKVPRWVVLLSPFYMRTLKHREVQKFSQVSKLVGSTVGISLLDSGVVSRAQL